MSRVFHFSISQTNLKKKIFFLNLSEHIEHCRARRGGGQQRQAGQRGAVRLCASSVLLAPALAAPAGCLVLRPPGGQHRGTTPDISQKRTLFPLLPPSRPPLCPEIFLFLSRAPSSQLPVEECSLAGPARTQLSAWHRPCSAGTLLRISLSWANTASPALQIPVSSFPSPPS